MEKVKIRLLQALNNSGMTPAELARASGLNKSSVSRYLSGKVEPKQAALFAMAKALNVSPSWLLGEEIAPDFVSKDELTVIIEQLSDKDKDTLKAIAETLLKKSKEIRDNADTDI